MVMLSAATVRPVPGHGPMSAEKVTLLVTTASHPTLIVTSAPELSGLYWSSTRDRLKPNLVLTVGVAAMVTVALAPTASAPMRQVSVPAARVHVPWVDLPDTAV